MVQVDDSGYNWEQLSPPLKTRKSFGLDWVQMQSMSQNYRKFHLSVERLTENKPK